MIVGTLLAVILGMVLYAILVRTGLVRQGSPFVKVVMGGYLLRLFIQFFIREVRLFSHDIGGDCLAYENYGRWIAALWKQTGIFFVYANDLMPFGATSLPPNLFGFIFYLNGGEVTRLGGVAIVAFAAALTAINMYCLAVEFGAERRNALLLATIFYFEPAFLFYTCDLYKDGLVLCFTIGALGSALRVGYRFSVLHAVIGAVCLWALWYVRFYLLFVTAAPLVVGLVGFGSKSAARPLLAALAIACGAFALAGFTDILQMATERASQTFNNATSERVMNGLTTGGSAVDFDDGGNPLGALHLKLLYTVFSPFPWSAGSLGFQVGKLDVFLWYFVVYRAYHAAKVVDRRLLLMLATFIVPCTVMYAMSMANIGLIMRQRLVIVAATMVLAALYKPPVKRKAVQVGIARRHPAGARAHARAARLSS